MTTKSLSTKRLSSKSKSNLVNILGLVAVVLIARWVYVNYINKSKFSQVATDLNKYGFRIFGSHSCGWTKKQLADFDDSSEKPIFVDCNKEKELCGQLGITGFPTLVDPLGNIFPGYKPPEALALIIEEFKLKKQMKK